MHLLFSGQAHLQFHWLYLGEPGGELPDHTLCFEGQKNGICGTRCVNYAHLSLGPHTGFVNLDLYRCEGRPPLHDDWEEVVESPLVITRACELHLAGFDGVPHGESMHLTPGAYRLRVAANGFGPIDGQRCEVCLWPAEFEEDEVLRCQSEDAAIRHERWQTARDEHLRSRWPQSPSWVEHLAPTLVSGLDDLPPTLADRIRATAADGEELMNRAAHALATDKYQQAIRLVAGSERSQMTTTWLLASLGEACFQGQDFGAGAAAFRHAAECPNGRGAPFIHLRLGQCELELANEPAAKAQLAQAYALGGADVFANEDPKYIDFFQNQGPTHVLGAW